MQTIRVILLGVVLGLVVAVLVWLGQSPPRTPAVAVPPPPASGPAAFRLGLIPERDIYQQRKAFRTLADYLGLKLGQPVELVTVNSYNAILNEFNNGGIDAAFLGSLIAVLAVDRHGGEVLAKPEYEDGVSTYRGVIFVPANSPIQSLDDLAGRRLGAVRTTTGGNIFPFYALHLRGIHVPSASQPGTGPRIAWVGTHDDVLREVAAGNLDAGAVKDLRLQAYLQRHPEVKLRILATSEAVPENGFVVRREVPAERRRQLRTILLEMPQDPEGRQVLAAMGLKRYVPCAIGDYAALYDIIETLGEHWDRLEIDGPPPKRPPEAPKAGPTSAPTRGKN